VFFTLTPGDSYFPFLAYSYFPITRIHRFLIHNILARRGFTPRGLIIPVSAAMLKNPVAYDASLETFSRPLLRQIDYTLDSVGEMQVQNDTVHWYRYIDMTAQAEALLGFISETISRGTGRRT